jgi:hypothetical protein
MSLREVAIAKALIAMRRVHVRWMGAALAAISNSSNEQFSRFGMLR